MASRSSTGIGVGITITLLGVVCLALFITTIVFLSKYNATRKNLLDTQAQAQEYIRADEQQSDTISRLRDLAKKDGKSVVGFLNTSLRDTMQLSTGSPADTVESMKTKLERIEGASTGSLIGVIADRDRAITDLNAKLAQSEKDRQTALTNQQNESARVKAIEANHQKTIAAMQASIDSYKAEVDQYRNEVGEAKNFMTGEIEKSRDRQATSESSLGDKIRGLENENLQLKDQLAKLRGDKNRDILKGRPEAALVDANIIALDSGSQTVTLDRGRRDKVVLGMQFAVYADPTAIRPGADGEYPVGKATVEVTNIGETSSTARVIRETRGMPVVRGDVVANAVYDPAKVYTMLVFGNFDANSDGVSTPAEADDIKAVIQQWGGKVTDVLSGDVDFLVLGQRPILPPRPGVDAPLAVVLEYQRLDALANKYDELFRQATSTSIPVLNENRLFNLIGGRPGRR
jgi:hypothetical protein